jgi:hypothetical protein
MTTCLIESPQPLKVSRPPMQALRCGDRRGLARLARAFTSLPIIDVSGLLEHGVRLHCREFGRKVSSKTHYIDAADMNTPFKLSFGATTATAQVLSAVEALGAVNALNTVTNRQRTPKQRPRSSCTGHAWRLVSSM